MCDCGRDSELTMSDIESLLGDLRIVPAREIERLRARIELLEGYEKKLADHLQGCRSPYTPTLVAERDAAIAARDQALRQLGSRVLSDRTAR